MTDKEIQKYLNVNPSEMTLEGTRKSCLDNLVSEYRHYFNSSWTNDFVEFDQIIFSDDGKALAASVSKFNGSGRYDMSFLTAVNSSGICLDVSAPRELFYGYVCHKGPPRHIIQLNLESFKKISEREYELITREETFDGRRNSQGNHNIEKLQKTRYTFDFEKFAFQKNLNMPDFERYLEEGRYYPQMKILHNGVKRR